MKLKNRILLAEDEMDTRRGLEKALTRSGYYVDVAKDGLEAAEKVRAKPFDLVVSDLKMPRIDGMELLHMTKETNKNVQFIIITGYGTVDSALEAMRLGASDYINKPFSHTTLIEAIKKALHKEAEEPPVTNKAKQKEVAVYRNCLGHSWFCMQPDGSVLIGASKEFYEEVGEVVYCDLPFKGDKVSKGESCVRMVNAVKHQPKKFFSPLSGTIIKINEKMETQPWIAQKDPYGDGWLYAIVPFQYEKEIEGLSKQDG